MHDIFGEKIQEGDVVVYPYSNDWTDTQYFYNEVVKVCDKSIIVRYETEKRKLKRVRRLGYRNMIVKCNEEQLERLRENEVFKALGGK